MSDRDDRRWHEDPDAEYDAMACGDRPWPPGHGWDRAPQLEWETLHYEHGGHKFFIRRADRLVTVGFPRPEYALTGRSKILAASTGLRILVEIAQGEPVEIVVGDFTALRTLGVLKTVTVGPRARLLVDRVPGLRRFTEEVNGRSFP